MCGPWHLAGPRMVATGPSESVEVLGCQAPEGAQGTFESFRGRVLGGREIFLRKKTGRSRC